MRTTLMPTYFNEFECIGSLCGDTCCSGFRIYIDKPTYTRYEKMNNKFLNERISINENANNEMDYGILKGTTNKCSFLNEQNLCELQIQFGHESLCYSCRSYPRINNLLGKEVERSLVMSCPEVVRILCNLEDGLDFEVIEDNNHYNIKKYINNDIADLVFTIRLICIQLIQDRSYSLEKRLERIGAFINGFTSKSGIDQIVYLQGDYQQHLDQFEYIQSERLHKLNKIKISKLLIEYMLEKGNVNERYKLATDGFLTNFSGADEELLVVYNKAEEKYVNYMKKFEFQLENIFVNIMFQEIFPFDNESILESYCILLFRFGIIKSKMLNLAVNNQLTSGKTSLIIQTYFKALDHNNRYIRDIYKLFYKDETSIEQVIRDFLI